jgi:tetratricopeptide (TPR) repeat protein
VVASDPQSLEAWCLLSLAHLGSGEDEDALMAARTAVACEPNAEWPHRLASVALEKLGRHREAVNEARESVRLAPDLWQAFVQLAMVLSREKSGRKEALGAAREAVALAPHEADTHIALGVAAAAARKKAEANVAFNQALAIDPQNTVAHNELARLQLSTANLTRPSALGEAAGSFAAAVRSDPRADVSRRNFELVIRVFLSWVSYLVFLDAWLVGRAVSSSAGAGPRLLPVALLALPVVFAANFLRSLTPDLRRHVLRAAFGRGLLVPVALVATALALLLVGGVAPPSARGPIAGVAAALAGVARFYLYGLVAARSAGGRGLGRRVLRLVAIGLGLLTAVLMVVAFVAAGSGDAGGVIVAAICAVLFAVSLYAVRRSKTQSSS